jgi:hypothetical protein
MRITIRIWFVFLLCLQTVCFADKNPPSLLDFSKPWELLESKENIKLYEHPGPHGGIHTFKVDMMFNATPDEILSIIIDINSYQQWVPNCQKAKILKRRSDGSLIYYLAVDLPWPAMNRDWVNKLTILRDADNNYVEATFTAIDNLYPKSDQYIRVTEHIAKWILIPISPTQTRSIWQWYTDPGGHLPGWFIEWASRDQVMVSIENIKRILSK